MPTILSSQELFSAASSIVLDWSSLADADASQVHHETETLLGWLKSYPHASSLHVYMRSMKKHEASRQVMSTLRSLGCTVTVVSAVRITNGVHARRFSHPDFTARVARSRGSWLRRRTPTVF